MPKIAISVPSGAHHRSLVLPLRELLSVQADWQALILTPGAPWADTIFPTTYYPRDRYSFADSADVERSLAHYAPDLVITPTSGLDPVDVTTLETAQQYGLRTLTLIESWDNVWKMERIQHGLGRPGQRIVLAGAFGVWNDIMKRHLLRAFPSIRSEQVTVVGAPRLDFFGPRYADRLPARAEALHAFGLEPEKRVLHLATTELYDHGHVARAMGEAKRRGQLPTDLQLYASVHPGGKMERHQPWAETHGFTIRFSPGRREEAPHSDFRYNPTLAEMLRLVVLFKETDVAVSLSSTVALESCVADRPVICAFFGKPLDWWKWRRSMVVRDFKEHYADLLAGGGISVARTPRQLVTQIQEYLAHPERDHEGRRHSAEIIAGTLAGDASERVLKLVRTLLD